MPQNPHSDVLSYLQGKEHAELKAAVASLQEWRSEVEELKDSILGYLRRGIIAAAMAAIGVLTTLFPGSPLAPIAHKIQLVGQLLTGG